MVMLEVLGVGSGLTSGRFFGSLGMAKDTREMEYVFKPQYSIFFWKSVKWKYDTDSQF
jgi:hypothetical protein